MSGPAPAAQDEQSGSLTARERQLKTKKGGPSSGNNVQVVVRLRPKTKKETAEQALNPVTIDSESKEVSVTWAKEAKKAGTKTFTFDRTYGGDSTQREVYDDVCRPIVDEVLKGFNCTVRKQLTFFWLCQCVFWLCPCRSLSLSHARSCPYFPPPTSPDIRSSRTARRAPARRTPWKVT